MPESAHESAGAPTQARKSFYEVAMTREAGCDGQGRIPMCAPDETGLSECNNQRHRRGDRNAIMMEAWVSLHSLQTYSSSH